ncbi:MAG: NAD(P)/FAD-dependent oxidoreductase [Solirubrobacterales bacterium]|nr:NAD(P)/FAD-dependent oxidoreductase [Solirubrobacterales bacterium]HMT04177.1 NAD(P)/FAD-dependent oxidoreductase [Solirubrobacterales bacterium]
MNYDAAIIGGGHNGLVAAYYLAREGLETVVLERRDIVGGCCVTEEFAPGYKASTGAYVLSMLREEIWSDMKLVERGIVVDPAGPSLHLFADGTRLQLSDDTTEAQAAIRVFSEHDADAYPAFEEHLAKLAGLVTPLIDTTPPSPRPTSTADLASLLKVGKLAASNRDLINEALFLFTTSVTQFLEERFENDYVKAAIGWHAINDSIAGPSSPGSAYILLHDHAGEDTEAGARSWGFVKGGIGRVTEAMADAAREAGAEIRTGAEVREVVVEDGRAAGVRLVDGDVIRAERVLSNADPKTTFLGLAPEGSLPDSFTASVRAYRCQGTSMKINLAVNRLPVATNMQGEGVQPYHQGIMEVNQPLADMDRAQAEARAGRPADDPHVEMCIPTVHDPSLAPEGHHVLTIDVNSQPYDLHEGSWEDLAEGVADRAIAKLETYFPGLTESILHRQVLSPLGLERLLGIHGGHALHGDMAFDQLFTLRPVRGWSEYRTPIDGLWLCGAGTHPGGGVTGANGRNCAREVLRDARGRPVKRLLGRRG